MTTRTVDQLDEWDSRSFSGGYGALQDLADEEFSGIVTAGTARLCMTKGAVVGILDGEIDDFESASGTIHDAPSPALPLLAVMQARSDEVRAEYYTEETPIEEVDKTLTQGNFTGFVELSENVLSGDYYLVYHQGRSMSVAYVGESQQLLTEDEAFERANDEVGIYEVRPVDIDVLEIPEPETDESADDTTEAEPVAVDETEGDDTAVTGEESSVEPESGNSEVDTDTAVDEGTETEQTAAAAAEPTAAGDQSDAGGQAEPHEGEREGATDARTEAATSVENTAAASEGAVDGGTDTATSPAQSETAAGSAPETASGGREQPSGTRGRDQQSGTRPSGGGGQPAGGSPEPISEGSGAGSTVEDLETRSIPSLDPDRTTEQGRELTEAPTPEPTQGTRTADGASGSRGETQSAHRSPDDRAENRATGSGGTRGGQPAEETTGDAGSAGQPSEQASAGGQPDVEELRATLEEREAEIERLESELADAESAREELEAERDELRERVEQLERRINELRTDDGEESVAERERLGPGEAIEGTNLFVRYRSKGDATIESALRGDGDAADVNQNLEIQSHTQFEAENVAVNGEPFEAFLADTIQYSFIEWLVRELPFDIRDTGNTEALGDLYEALPKIDRAELNGVVTVQYEEDGDQHRSQERFDVVVRDRMGNPLAVANMNESRQPASRSMMESLVTAAQRVGESNDSLAGVFLVTSSFFEPEAMEAAADATGGGLLSRDKRKSFVKLSRKDGFHLCLVEAREDKYNLSVPEI